MPVRSISQQERRKYVALSVYNAYCFFFFCSFLCVSESVGSGGTKLTVLNLEILSYKNLHDKL